MMTLSTLFIGLLAWGQVDLTLPGLGGAATTAKAPQVGVELLANRTGLVPGQTIDLAVRFKIEAGWHIYWRNPGEGGMETRFQWRLPAGFEISPAHFPPPTRHVDLADAHTFILEWTPAVLFALSVPAGAQPGDITIGVDVTWLVCKEACYPGNKSLALTLPVVADAAAAGAAHEEVFEAARAMLPVQEPKHLKKLWAAASVDKVRPGASFEVAVVLDVLDEHHLNSHTPNSDFLIPTDVFHHRTEGLFIGRARFPQGRLEESPLADEKVSVYRGRVVVVLPVEADAELTGDELRVSGIVTYQACSDRTHVCYPPTAAPWSVTLPVVGADAEVAAVHAELFSGAGGLEAVPGKGFSFETDVSATMVEQDHPLVVWLLLALLAGLVLNVTPCVLPVISIKVLSFVQQASASPGKVFRLGLAFSLGMLAVFNVLAVLVTAAGLAWGQHFQSPHFTIAMAAIVFAFGLSLFGVYTLGVPRAVGDLAGKAEGEGYLGSIAKGALATVMGTPCLGPFLGSVLLWAARQPPAVVFLVFNTIGLGMALPYMLLTANPRWLRFVPKPGPWLETFKHAMGFLLMVTVVYLLDILQGQLGGSAVVWSLVLLIGVAVACWIAGRWLTVDTSAGGRAAVLGVSVVVVALSAWLAFGVGFDLGATPTHASPVAGGRDATELPWVPFSMDALEEQTAAGRTVFLDITAKWCPNCKYNLEFVFNTAEVAAAVAEYDVVPMLADWTARDETIGRLINKLAPGASIPLCAVFPASRPNEPIVMLGIVTKQQVVKALREAAGGK